MADAQMADPFCPSCGTEVDEDARFCPTCGRTLLLDEAALATGPAVPQAAAAADATGSEPEEPETVAIPPAPSWRPPDPEPESAPAEPPTGKPEPKPEPTVDSPPADSPPAAEAPPPPLVAPPPPATGDASEGTSGSQPDLPFTWPTTLSGWLIGAGSGFAALALLPRLGNLLNLLIFLALLAICATIFLADRMPAVPQRRLATLVTLMVALGVALERAAFTVRGIDTIFLITMIIAAGGTLLIELDRDRPVPPPRGPG